MLIQLNKFHSDNNSLESVALRTPIFLATWQGFSPGFRYVSIFYSLW